MAVAQCSSCSSIHRTHTVPSSLRYCSKALPCWETLQPKFLYRCYSDYGYAAKPLLSHRLHCGCHSVCPITRRRAPRHSSAVGLRSQRHRPRQHIGPPPLLMAQRGERSLSEVYFDPTKVGSYGGVAGLRRVTRLPQKTVNGMVVGTGRLHLTQTSETSFQETTRHRGWYASAVAGRSRRHVEGQTLQRRYDLSPHGDRRLLESGLVCSHEEQVRSVDGGSAAIHVRRRLATDVADRRRQRISEQIRSVYIAELRHPSLLHAQRGDEGMRRGTVQPNVEVAHVALLHETPDVAVHRHPSGLDAIV